ncbi:hypothetical protein [Methylomonas sp. MK1]|nr:hypothetical protein [Methylomonas sp. MK1]
MNTMYDKPLYTQGCKTKFETAFAQTSALIFAMPGYVSQSLLDS